jgi:hypothetical protein
MRIHELLAGHPLLETDQDNPGPGTSTPLATIAAPGAATGGVAGVAGAEPVDQEFPLTGFKPLRRLKHLKQGGLTA